MIYGYYSEISNISFAALVCKILFSPLEDKKSYLRVAV